MNPNFDHMLERYFEGISTIEEEIALKTYFTSGTVVLEHEIYKAWFNDLKIFEQISAPAHLSTEELLEKYWDGTSSLTEEMALKEHMTANKNLAFDDAVIQWFSDLNEIENIPYSEVDLQNNIDRILEKYWDGNTSLTEENTLKAYFNGNNIAAHHEIYSDLFAYTHTLSNIKYPNQQIQTNSKQNSTKVISLKKYVTAAAAALIFIISGIFIIKENPFTTQSSQLTSINEIDDPDQALEITLRALAMVGEKYNEGQANILNSLDLFDKTNIFK